MYLFAAEVVADGRTVVDDVAAHLGFSQRRPVAGRLADVAFPERIADTNDHEPINRSVENVSQ